MHTFLLFRHSPQRNHLNRLYGKTLSLEIFYNFPKHRKKREKIFKTKKKYMKRKKILQLLSTHYNFFLVS